MVAVLVVSAYDVVEEVRALLAGNRPICDADVRAGHDHGFFLHVNDLWEHAE